MSRFRHGSGGARILATACWHFPIYSQTFVYQELLALMRRGHRVRMVYCEARPESELGADFRPLWRARCRMRAEHAIRRRDFDHFARTVPNRVAAVLVELARQTGRPAEDLRDDPQVLQAFSFARIAQAYGADYIHSYFFYEGTLFAFVAARLLDVPRGVSCYADHMLQDHPLKLVPFHVRDADIVIATSRRIRDELVDLAGTDPGTILVKPNAVDLATLRRTAAPAAPDGTGGGLRVVAISRIDPKKGLEYLVEAARLLLDAGVPVSVEVLGGADAHSEASKACADRLRQRIADLRLEGAVHLRGVCTRTEVRAALARADVFALPAVELGNNDKDGIPTALLEAMAMGLAVVATGAGSITEVIEHEANGLLVPQRDPAALADALARLAADAGARRTLGAAAERTIAARYDVAVCEPAFHDRVARVLRPRPAVPGLRALATALARTARTPDWFAYKIPPLLAVAYAGLLVFGAAPPDGLSAVAPLLWGILLAGAYGHAVNDLTDMEEDRRAGKRNTMRALPARLRVPAVALLAALGLGPLALFAEGAAPAALVAGIYALSTLYSMPPVRLKCRGALGVLADASAAHLLPSLAIALTTAGVAGASGPAATAFVVSAAVWSLAAGLRGIVVHQIIDRAADRRGRVATFAGRLRNKRLRALVLLFIFPLEVIGLAVFVGLGLWAEPWLGLPVAGWLTLEGAKIRRGWRLPIFYPGRRVERYLPLLNNEFHEVYLPCLLLAGLCLQDAWYLPLFALHLVVFSGNIAARLVVARRVLADAR
ncbi:MAG TPA: glycosyltransferase [Azospirillum sp.]|nr:glycosyltransferase [Azospirillum sp.]